MAGRGHPCVFGANEEIFIECRRIEKMNELLSLLLRLLRPRLRLRLRLRLLLLLLLFLHFHHFLFYFICLQPAIDFSPPFPLWRTRETFNQTELLLNCHRFSTAPGAP